MPAHSNQQDEGEGGPDAPQSAQLRHGATSEIAELVTPITRPGMCLRIPRSAIRYLLVGVANTCIGLGTIYFGLYALRLHDLPANIFGYAVGIICSFLLNRNWTFSSVGPSGQQFVRFLIVTAAAYLANLGTVEALVSADRMNHYLAQALGTLPYTALGYLGHRFFTFRQAACRLAQAC